MLQWNESVEEHMPPFSVLLAGLLAPATLSIFLWCHILLIIFALLPVAGLCGWAVYTDWGQPCGVIPGLKTWAVVQGSLALILILARVVMAIQVARAQGQIAAKSKEMRRKLDVAEARVEASGSGAGISDLQELFVIHSVMLQHALLAEDGTRRSFFNHILGVGTVLWLVAVFWVWGLTLCFTFIPGVVAFHPDARGAGRDFCAAWACVVAARLTIVCAVLFLFVNVGTVAAWVSDVAITASEAKILEKARAFDQSIGGVPIAEMLVKAVVVRGPRETAMARLA